MKLILEDKLIYLPCDLTIEERVILVDEITRDNPSSFEFGIKKEKDEKVKVRLDILGTYILRADSEKKIVTHHKKVQISKNELSSDPSNITLLLHKDNKKRTNQEEVAWAKGTMNFGGY